jgi:phosphatidylserine decarboxylase
MFVNLSMPDDKLRRFRRSGTFTGARVKPRQRHDAHAPVSAAQSAGAI